MFCLSGLKGQYTVYCCLRRSHYYALNIPRKLHYISTCFTNWVFLISFKMHFHTYACFISRNRHDVTITDSVMISQPQSIQIARIGLLCVLPHPKVSMFSPPHKRYEAALARIVALTRRRTTSLLQSATRRACTLSTVCGRRTHSTAMYIVVDDNIATVRADLRRR